MKVGLSHSSQCRLTVSSPFMPSIWNAPSPMVHTTGRSGNANFAAIAYGIAANIVARRPERFPIMLRPSLMWCPYQSAVVPASAVTMTSSGSRSLSTWNTRRGLTGSAFDPRRLLDHLLPGAHALDHASLPGPVRRPLEQRQQRSERGLGIAPEVHLHWVPQAQVTGLEIDLHPAGLARRRQELAVREVACPTISSVSQSCIMS